MCSARQAPANEPPVDLKTLHAKIGQLALELRDRKIDCSNQVFALDTTYIPMAHGFVYLTAVKYEEVDLKAYESVGEDSSRTGPPLGACLLQHNLPKASLSRSFETAIGPVKRIGLACNARLACPEQQPFPEKHCRFLIARSPPSMKAMNCTALVVPVLAGPQCLWPKHELPGRACPSQG